MPAPHADEAYASDASVRARRYMVLVRMIVPAGLGSGGVRVTEPAAEFYIDVSHERPVGAGSEVRLRRARPGA